MGIISAVILLGVLIFFHELGHFIVAKLSGIYVEKFSIGFGPHLVSWKRGETVYALSAIPLGGYVKMYGENPDEEAEVDEALADRAFNRKSLGARSAVIAAGPVANFLLAVIVYAVIFMIGTPRFLTEVGKPMEGMPAYEAGFKKGDTVLAIDGKEVKYWDEMVTYITDNPGKEIDFTVQRDGKVLELTAAPETVADKNIFGEPVQVGRIGVQRGDAFESVSYNPLTSVYKGAVQTWDVTVLTVKGIVKIFQRVVPADNIGGPIMILQMASTTAETGLVAFLSFMALISVNLAILNLLPIPVLDGGHLFFNLIEAVIRKPVSVEIRQKAQMVGLMLLLSLMFFAFYNDIMRIVS